MPGYLLLSVISVAAWHQCCQNLQCYLLQPLFRLDRIGDFDTPWNFVPVGGVKLVFRSVDDAVSAGEQELERTPAAVPNDAGLGDIAGAVLVVVTVEKKATVKPTAEDDGVLLRTRCALRD